VDKAIEREVEIIKVESHLDRCVTEKFGRYTTEEKEKIIYEEMCEGLNLPGLNNEKADQENVEDEEDNDEEYKALNPPVKNRKKDKKAKRKKSEAIERENQKQRVECELKKLKDINKINEFEKDIKKAADKVVKKTNNRQKRAEESFVKPRRIAMAKFEEPEVELTEVSDLASDLRTIKPGSSLIVDRFKSLQKRNIIPPKKGKVPRSARKRNRLKKFKSFTLRSHKET
jgi:nucleolar protein 53